jgi:hypothetical protein
LVVRKRRKLLPRHQQHLRHRQHQLQLLNRHQHQLLRKLRPLRKLRLQRRKQEVINNRIAKEYYTIGRALKGPSLFTGRSALLSFL